MHVRRESERSRRATLPTPRAGAALFRLLRSSRFLLLLVLGLFGYLLRRQVPARPVPVALLPIIRQSGQLLNRIAPAAALRVKNWHDLQQATTPRVLTEAELEAQSSHTFHPNGLLLVNPRGRHPIHVLIERAEQRWKDKLAKQSRTLKDAVREYKQRYRRNPPRGFDAWYVHSAAPATLTSQVGICPAEQRSAPRRVRSDSPRSRAALGTVRLIFS